MESKYRKFYVDWWNIRKATIWVVGGSVILIATLVAGLSYASRNNWFVPDQAAAIPKDAARIISFEGEVRITRAATRETIVVTKETYAAAGDLIQTMTNGRAIIQMIDGARVQMRPDSTLVIKESSSLFGGKDVRVSVDDGQVNVRTNDQQDTNNIVELAESENRLLSNTDASFDADAQTQGGEIRVSRGGVETTIGGEKTVLNENEFAALKGGQMTAREKLVAPPRPVSPSNSAQITDGGSGVNVMFAWQDAEGNPAINYHLQVSRSPIFASDAILADRNGLTSRDFRLTLTPGTYYWRLKGTSRSGQTTNWNDAWKVNIVRGTGGNPIEVADLQVERVGGNIYLITGRTSPGLLVRSLGRETFAGSDGAFRLQIAAATSEVSVEIGDDRGNRTGLVISLRNGAVVRRY